MRYGTAEALHEVLRANGTEHPLGLRMVAMAATACGDDIAAEQAAARFLALTDGRDPVMRELLAPAQMLDDEPLLAAESTELAVGGTAGDQEEPIRRIVAGLDRRGRPDLVVPLLSTAYLRTGRDIYGRLLDAAVPRAVRTTLGRILLSIGIAVAGIGLAVSGHPVLLAVSLPLMVIGAVVMVAATVRPAGGIKRSVARNAQEPLRRYRKRTGGVLIVAPAVATGAGVFTWSTMMLRGRGPAVAAPLLAATFGAGVAAALLMAAALLVYRRHRRTSYRLALARQVPAARCRCWETGLLIGPEWDEYRAGHLITVGCDELSSAQLRVCPTTDSQWLHLPDRAIALAVRIPEPEPTEPHTGVYL